MAKNFDGINSITSESFDPYAGVVNTCITNSVLYANSVDWRAVKNSAENIILIPEDATVHIGEDFSMSASEFRACMKLLRKMAMKEVPEDYI